MGPIRDTRRQVPVLYKGHERKRFSDLLGEIRLSAGDPETKVALSRCSWRKRLLAGEDSFNDHVVETGAERAWSERAALYKRNLG